MHRSIFPPPAGRIPPPFKHWHPFWAVRRLTQKQLDSEIAEKLETANGVPCSLPKFNCQLVHNVHSSVIISTIKGKVMNCTRLVSVPYLTNTEFIAKGDELILEVVPTNNVKKKKSASWRSVQKEKERNIPKRQKIGDQKPAVAAGVCFFPPDNP